MASGQGAHAEGCASVGDIIASGRGAHAEGTDTTASGNYAHAEGSGNTASKYGAHAEGYQTEASGYEAHAEGYYTEASGDDGAHAEGWRSIAAGSGSHAQNVQTVASKAGQTAIGTWNKEDTDAATTHPSGTAEYGKYAFIVGNGTSDSARSNAIAFTWDGDTELALDTSAASGTTDGNLYAAITTLGWQSEVIV